MFDFYLKLLYILKPIKDIYTNYYVISAIFNDDGKLYDYLYQRKRASIGGKVVVESQESFKEAKVMYVKELYEDELLLPLNKILEIK